MRLYRATCILDRKRMVDKKDRATPNSVLQALLLLLWEALLWEAPALQAVLLQALRLQALLSQSLPVQALSLQALLLQALHFFHTNKRL